MSPLQMLRAAFTGEQPVELVRRARLAGLTAQRIRMVCPEAFGKLGIVERHQLAARLHFARWRANPRGDLAKREGVWP